ncbi:hypothetical protein K3495_g1511 [Podosphaera aphanis]|nr:hypothetical protein K3495_g1511 [Podosphaera aphanis]
MVQNLTVPGEEGRSDDCWNRDPKNFVESHDTTSHPGIPNLSRFQVYNQPTARLQSRIHQPNHAQASIQAALMNCGVDIADFVLVYAGSHGSENPIVISSPGLNNYAHRIVNDRVCTMFTRCVHRSRNEVGLHHSGPRNLGQFDIESSNHETWENRLLSPSAFPPPRMRDAKSDDSDEGLSPHGRKRARAQMHRLRQSSAEALPSPIPVTKTQPLTIGNDAEVERFYFIRFKDMQQSSCKVMGKAFVKLVEPKKQTHHPYTGGNSKAPLWWPPTEGENAVRHKEPDHLLKPERINLLVHILKMIIEPNEKQEPTVQKLDLNIKKLEETTMEVMSNWFNDKEHPENLQKKKYLKEIFRVARMQERYKRGEVDATTTVPVMCGAENRTQDASDDDGDEIIYTNPDAEPETNDVLPVVAGVQTPESIVSPSILQHAQHSQHLSQQIQPQSESDMCLPSHAICHNTQPRTSLSNASYDSQLYRLDINSFQPSSQSIPSLQDPSRRRFAHTGFNSPQTALPPQWSTPMMNNPNSNSMFFAQQPNNLTYLPPPPPQPSMHSTHHGFDNLSVGNMASRGFDTGSPLVNQQPLSASSLNFNSQSNFGYSPGSNTYRSQEDDIKQEQNQTQLRQG